MYGSCALRSASSIFSISRSRRSLTVGYVTPYWRATSFSEPDASTKRRMKAASSASRFAIHSGTSSKGKLSPPLTLFNIAFNILKVKDFFLFLLTWGFFGFRIL